MKDHTNVLAKSYTVGQDNCTFFIVARTAKDGED